MQQLPVKSLLIALDADGVLVNYNEAFGRMWERFFNTKLTCVEPRAYHATTYWGVEAPEFNHPFWEFFDNHGWEDMPAMPDAVDACHRLVEAGHRLVCVTSMPSHRHASRLANLRALGFPIDQVIATGHCADRTANPKKAAIEALGPDWFVDDELRKLKDLPGVKCVLVDPVHPDTPNAGQDDRYLALRVPSLAAFTDYLISRPEATSVSTHGSCGHALRAHDDPDGSGFSIALRGEPSETTRGISYRNVCAPCYQDAVASGQVLHDAQEERAWMTGMNTSRPRRARP